MSDEVKKHFEDIASQRHRWEKKSSFYYRELYSFLKRNIPEGKSILEIGCGRASLLKALKPELGVGIDFSFNMLIVARVDYGCQQKGVINLGYNAASAISNMPEMTSLLRVRYFADKWFRII